LRYSQFRLPYGTPKQKFLINQRAGYVRPLSYRLSTAGAQVLRILIMSNDDLCAQLVVTRSEANPYIRNIERRIGSDEVLHEMEFTRRLDLVLPRGEVPQILLMFDLCIRMMHDVMPGQQLVSSLVV
ncbi:hypothetical protein COOONC_11307, partial [Cooperia oncophora]